MKLTEKQKLFCKEYLVDWDATQAAIRAGYDPGRAGQTGIENLKKPEIGREIQSLLDEKAQKNEITPDKLIREMAKIAFADSSDMNAPKYSDKLRALELLAKHLGIFKETAALDMNSDIDVRLTFTDWIKIYNKERQKNEI